jgi:hypothetical protein
MRAAGRIQRAAIAFGIAWLLVALGYYAADRMTTARRQPVRASESGPRCVGLQCFTDADCGSYCTCLRAEGERLGACKAR